MGSASNPADLIMGGRGSSIIDTQASISTDAATPVVGTGGSTGALGKPTNGAQVLRHAAMIVMGAVVILVLFGTVLFKEARLG